MLPNLSGLFSWVVRFRDAATAGLLKTTTRNTGRGGPHFTQSRSHSALPREAVGGAAISNGPPCAGIHRWLRRSLSIWENGKQAGAPERLGPVSSLAVPTRPDGIPRRVGAAKTTRTGI